MILRRRLPHLLLATSSLILAAVAWRFWSLVLTNLYLPGSLAWSHPLVVPLTLAFTGITILPYVVVTYRLLPAPLVLSVLITVLVVVGSWIIYPVVCDTTESFLDQPNRRCTCAGFTMHWYPRDVFDYSDVAYCIGVESPVR